MRKGKQESIQVNWFSPRLMSLLDYLMHKAPYWSIYNYEKRLDENVRDAFMRHVLEVHKESRDDLTGLRRVLAAPSEIYADVFPHAVFAEIWMSRVANDASHKDDSASGQIQGRAKAGTTQAAIDRMMGERRARASAPAGAGEVAASEAEGANGARGSCSTSISWQG